jgi:hypothetical protein
MTIGHDFAPFSTKTQSVPYITDAEAPVRDGGIAAPVKPK